MIFCSLLFFFSALTCFNGLCLLKKDVDDRYDIHLFECIRVGIYNAFGIFIGLAKCKYEVLTDT